MSRSRIGRCARIGSSAPTSCSILTLQRSGVWLTRRIPAGSSIASTGSANWIRTVRPLRRPKIGARELETIGEQQPMARLDRALAQPRHEIEDLEAGHVGVETVLAGHVAHHRARLPALSLAIETKQLCMSAARTQQI